MLYFEEASRAARHLSARREAERHTPAGLLALLLLLGLHQTLPYAGDCTRLLSMAIGTLLLPWVMGKLIVRGNLQTYRLFLASYVLNGLLLGVLAFLELRAFPWRPPEFLPPGLDLDMGKSWPWVAALLAALYWVCQFPAWRRRLRGYPALVQALRDRPDPVALGRISALAAQAVSSEPTREAGWAEFRSVPATPRNWKRFLRLDTERHGLWRVAFDDAYALVVFKDGSRLEAVPRKGLKMVAEDPSPGSKWSLCLVRWNDHLHEGRITRDNLLKILAWNTGPVPA